MLAHSKLLVSSIATLLFLTGNIIAKDLPITQEVELTIPVGKFSVIEFPFKISSKNITSFLIKKKLSKSGEQIKKETSLLDTPVRKPIPKSSSSKKKGKKASTKKKSKYIDIKQNKNGFTFFPKKEGILKMVIWGYDHPILLTLTASRNDGFATYKFILPQSKSKEVFATEQGSHEKIINKLMVHLFNQTLPKGYKNSSRDVIYEIADFELRLNRELIGRKYSAQEWILTNNASSQFNIHEESFYKPGIYGVSLEVDIITPKESIRVFIVKKASEKRD